MPNVLKNKQDKFMKHLNLQKEKIANSMRSIILMGEYGSGKSWFARKIHNSSIRRVNSFIEVDCYSDTITTNPSTAKFHEISIADNELIFSEEIKDKSRNGTIYFKGLNELPKLVQNNLFNKIQNNEGLNLSGNKNHSNAPRFIGSVDVSNFNELLDKSNSIQRNLGDTVKLLFYPPLRYRKSEISFLIEGLLSNEISEKYKYASRRISPRALYMCLKYDWPGNFIELKNVIEHSALVADGNWIQPIHLPSSVIKGQPNKYQIQNLKKDSDFRRAEKQLLRNVLTQSQKKEAAWLLGINELTLSKKIDFYKINATS